MKDKKKWDLIALASIPLIMTLGNSMLIPVLPTIEKVMEISSFQVSMLITIYSIAAIIFIPIAGFLSDQYGRKKLIIPSLIIVAVGGLISGMGAWLLEGAYWVILVGRLVQGIGVSGTAPVVLPLVGDMFRKESDISKGLGIIETANTFGKVLSPIVGSLLAAVVWFMPFLAIPLFSLISLILVVVLVKAPKEQTAGKTLLEFIGDTKATLKQKGRWLAAIFVIGAILMFVLFGVLFYLSESLELKHNIHGIRKGFFLAFPLGALSLASYLTGKKIGRDKQLMRSATLAGLILLATSHIASVFFASTYAHLVLLLFGGIGIGAALPSLDALITEGIEKEERGTITSIYSSMRFIGVALGPPVAVVLLEQGLATVFLTMAAASTIAVVVTFVAIRPKGIQKL